MTSCGINSNKTDVQMSKCLTLSWRKKF